MSAVADRTWTPVDLVRWTGDYLASRGFPDGRLNAELLLAGVLGLRRLDLYLQFDRPLSAEELAEFKSRLKRRLRHEPLQYIEGSAAFRTLELSVDPRVLIPRPETELLVGAVLAWAGDHPGADVLDLGTGSGAIALSLRAEGRFGRIIGTDISPAALEVARANARKLGSLDSVEFREGSLFDPVSGEVFDVIVSNPPYVALTDRRGLDAEVVDWEPAEALFAGADGLDQIRVIVDRAPGHLRPGGLLAIEIGETQAPEVTNLIQRTGAFDEPRVRSDYAGRDRIVIAERLADSVGPGDG